MVNQLNDIGTSYESYYARRTGIFDGAEDLKDGSSVINCDPYGNRYGYRLHGVTSVDEIRKYFSPYFKNFSFGHADNDYYGISERVFWVVCQQR